MILTLLLFERMTKPPVKRSKEGAMQAQRQPSAERVVPMGEWTTRFFFVTDHPYLAAFTKKRYIK